MSPVLSLRLQNLVFHLLLLALAGVLAWLSQQHRLVLDWTDLGRNSISPASATLLEQIDGPIELEAFLGPADAPRQALQRLVEAYRRHKPDIELQLVDPQTEPGRTRQLGIRGEGEMLVRYGGREERLQQVTEHSLSNALRRLARGRDRWLAFVAGHGERSPVGSANHDLGQFAARLESRGIRPRLLNLVETPQLPDNLHALVLASPQLDYLPGELAVLRDYLRRGGRLLLTLEPESRQHPAALLDELGVRALPGLVIDATTQRYNIDDPAFALISDYPAEAVTPGFNSISLLPRALALSHAGRDDWQYWPVLRSSAQSWSETGPIEGEISPDAAQGDTPGPLHLALALSRARGAGEQRVLVVGDGDFLANAYLGNGANLELGLAMIEWLLGDGETLDIPPLSADDRNVEIPEAFLIGLALTSLLGLPVALLAGGAWVWRRRRRV